MKILHIVEDYSLKSGGLRTVIKNLDYYLKKSNIESYILSTDKEEEDSVDILTTSNSFLYSKEWFSKFDGLVDKNGINIFHIHGTWTYLNLAAAKYAVKKNIPFILSPHGMYEPWLWNKGRLKKVVYFNLVSKKWFEKATFLHAITEIESNSIKKYFNNKNIIKIPNLISFNTKEVLQDNISDLRNNKYILYIGRINEKKGIDILIKSLKNIENKEVQLLIAGGHNEYQLMLQKLVQELKLENRVVFLGMVKGEVKTKLIRNAWVMIAPSHSEAIGMVNLEAALYKTPNITTFETGLLKAWSDHGGMLISPVVEEVTKALNKALNWTIEERIAKGDGLYHFAKENYSWESKLSDWITLYKQTIKHQ